MLKVCVPSIALLTNFPETLATSTSISNHTMAVLPRDDTHNESAPGTKMATALALVLVFCFVLVYLIAKSRSPSGPVLGVIRETGTRRSTAGLRRDELDSFPISKFKAGRQKDSKRRPWLPIPVEQDAAAPTRQPTTACNKTITHSRLTLRLPESIHSFSSKMSFTTKCPFGLPLQSCSICTEDFVDGDDIRRLPCDHIFHPRCIDPWLSGFAVTCPLWQVYPFSLRWPNWNDYLQLTIYAYYSIVASTSAPSLPLSVFLSRTP